MFTAKVMKEKVVDNSGPAKPVKKSFFPGDKAQGIFIVISRLPKTELMIEAVDKLNQRSVSVDSLQNLLKAWPSDEFDDLMAEYAADPKAEWEKSEAYFIALG